MAVDIVMPRLGWGGNEASLVEWSKQDGEQVEVGDVVCLVEGDKVVTEVESIDRGILRIAPGCPPVGMVVPVGTVLGYLLAPGEALPGPSQPEAVDRPAAAESAQAPVAGPSGDTRLPAQTREAAAASPRARRVARELGVDWRPLQGSGQSGRIVERDVRAAAEQPAARVTPLARRLAREAGVDVAALAASTGGRRLTRADVAQAAEGAAPVAEAASARVGGVRRLIAERLSASAHTVAPVTLTTEAEATALVALRQAINAEGAAAGEGAVSYNDLLARLVALALGEYPALNASLEGETIVQHGTVNIGLAVDTERGLLAPVLRDVGALSVRRIAAQSAALIAAARSGRLTAQDLHGGTFTISNLGMYEVDAFTPIINLPECAILGVGRIVARAVVVDEERGTLAARKMLALSLTFDHRLVDGAPAARFLRRVKEFIERPTLWLVR